MAVGELAICQPAPIRNPKQPSSSTSAPSAAAASSGSTAGSGAAAEAADTQQLAASVADLVCAQAQAAARQSPTDSQARQPPQVPRAQLVRCCLAQGTYAQRTLEEWQHSNAEAAGRQRRPGGRAPAAAASRLLATAAAGLAGLLTASASITAAAGKQVFLTANAGVSDMQPLLRQCAELAKDAWAHAEQMPGLATELIEAMEFRRVAASDAQNATELLSPYPWRCLQLSACLCFLLKGLVLHSWSGFYCHKQTCLSAAERMYNHG